MMTGASGRNQSRQQTRPENSPLIATFPGQRIKIRTWFLVFFPGFLAVCLSSIYGIILARNAYLDHGPALAFTRAQPWFLSAVIGFIVLVSYFLYCLFGRLQKFKVFEDGIAIRSPFFSNRSYRWEDVSGITSGVEVKMLFGVKIRTEPTGRIFTYSGKELQLRNRFERLPQLMKLIKNKSYPIIWPSIKSKFRSGQPIEFGILGLDIRQITISGKKIPWSTIKGIKIKSGNLVVELRDNFSQKIPLENIQNLELFFKVIDWGIST